MSEETNTGKVTLDAATIAQAKSGHVTAPIHAEKIPAPPDSGPTTDPGRARWEEVVADVVRHEIQKHETQARERYTTILDHFAVQDKRWVTLDKRVSWLERHGAPRAAMLLLLVAVVLLSAQVYFDYARLVILRAAPVIRAEKIYAQGK